MGYKSFKILLPGLFILLLACTDDNNESHEDGSPLMIEGLAFSGVTVRSTTLSSGDIGVYRLISTGYSETKSNVHYTNTGSGWGVASGITPIYLTKNSANLCAYYPYSSADDYADGTVTLTSQEYASAADLCYQTGVSASSTTAAIFTLSHAYALITFTLTRGSSYPANGACAVSNVSIANTGIVNTGSLDMTTGTYTQSTSGTALTYAPTASSATPTTLATTGITSGGSATTSILMAPVTTAMSGDITLTFTVDGKAMSTTLSLDTYTELTTLAANTNYSIPITINGTALSVGTVTFTTGWTTQTVTNTVSSTSGSMVESNCYIVQPGGVVYIPVSRATAGQKVATSNSSYTLPTDWTTGLYWTDNSNGLSSSGAIASIVGHVGAGYITVTAGSAEGNSVIAIYDTDGSTILWSWHIWTTDEPATEMVNGNIWMDRNLGATARASNTADTTFATCGGLMYQWGRKDPFVGSNGTTTGSNATALSLYNFAGPTTAADYGTALCNASLTSSASTVPTAVTNCPNDFYLNVTSLTSAYADQLAASIRFPMLFLTGWAGSTAKVAAAYTAEGGKSSWGGEYGESKSIFDPCPAGWRVPSGRKASSTLASPWSTWTTAQSFTISTYAALLWNATLNLYRYPSAGSRLYSSGALSYVGSIGSYWSGSPNSSGGYYLRFTSSIVGPAINNNRATGFSVRCVQEF